MNNPTKMKEVNTNFMFIVIITLLLNIGLKLAGINYSNIIVLLLGIFMPTVYILSKGEKTIDLKELKFNKVDLTTILLTIFLSIVIYPVILTINVAIISFLPNIDATTFELIQFDSTLELILNFISLGLLPAIVNEFLFRGYFQNEINKNNKIFSLFYVSFLFALAHLNPYNFIIPFILSILFGCLYILTNSIYPAIIGHLTTNVLAIIFGYLGLNGFVFKHIASKNFIFLIISALALILMIFISGLVFNKFRLKYNKTIFSKEEVEDFKQDLITETFRVSNYMPLVVVVVLFIISFLGIYF